MAITQQILQLSTLTAEKRACCGRSDVRTAHRLHGPEVLIPRLPSTSAQRCTRVRLAAAAVEQQVRQDVALFLHVQCYSLKASNTCRACMLLLYRWRMCRAGDPRPRCGQSTQSPTMMTSSRGSGPQTLTGEPACHAHACAKLSASW